MDCTCKIQWLDDHGKPTPDNNKAVMIAQFHKPVHAQYTGKLIEYSSLIQDSFPICTEHYAKVTADMRFPRGGWTFVPLSDNAS
jgi:hypothetical protein